MKHEEDLLEPLEPALRCAFASTAHRSDSLASILASTGHAPSASADEAPLLDDGDSIADTYRVLEPIAHGGVGHVFRARDLVFGRDVAIKLLRPRFADRPDMIRRFWQEAQIGAQLQHPGIVGVYDIGVTAQRRPYFAMKLVRGRTLAAMLADGSADRAARIGVFARLCEAIGYAHARGVVHRDLKPANVMIGAHGEVQVMDWGLARLLHRVADAERDGGLDAERIECVDLAGASVHGGVLGTPGYMAPEQAHGHATTPRADVFSLGAILCEVLVGQPPFEGADSNARLDATRRGELAPVLAKLAGSDAAPELVDIARRCVALDPSARPADAEVVAHAIADHLASVQRRLREAEVEAARAAGEAAQERRARRLLTLWLGTVAIGVAIVAVATLWWQRARAKRTAIVEASVRAAVDSAQRLQLEATQTPTDLGRWDLAVDAAARSVALAGDPLVHDEDVRRRAADALEAARAARADAEARRAQADADRRFLAHSAHAQAEFPRAWDYARYDDQLTAAFAAYGIPLDEMPPNAAAGRIRASAIRAQLLRALDACLLSRRYAARPIEACARVEAVAELAEPDPFRATVRAAVLAESSNERLEELMNTAAARDNPTVAAKLADQLGWQGKPAVAVEWYRRFLRQHAGDFIAWFQYGYWAYAVGPPGATEATRAWTVAAALDRSSAVVRINLAAALTDAGENDRALDVIREALELEPGYAPAHVNHGLLLERRGDERASIAAYRRAIDLDPGLPIPRGNLARLLAATGDFDGAVETARAAVEVTPRDLWTRTTLADVLDDADGYDEAVDAWRAVVELAPDDASLRGKLVLALANAGRLDEALQVARQAVDLAAPDPRLLDESARCIDQIESSRAAVATLARGHSPAAEQSLGEARKFAKVSAARHAFADSVVWWERAFELASEHSTATLAADYHAAAIAAVCATRRPNSETDGDRADPLLTQALAWLRAGLDRFALDATAAGSAAERAHCRRELARWRGRLALRAVRDPVSLAAVSSLTAEQRTAWTTFWSDVERLLVELDGDR